MDLARIITEPVIAAKHEANAVAYFRKVYGESGCETASPTKASGPNSRVPESMNANRQLPGNYNTFAAARPRTRTTLEPDGLHNLECSTKDYCDLQAMDRYPLSDAHALECEFYSELMKERKRNETLEDEVRHIRKQLEVSKRAERAALQQVKVEIVARRKAELRAEHERPRRKEESFVGARVVKPLFGDLVNILQNVVEGDKQAALQACHHPPAAADPAPVS